MKLAISCLITSVLPVSYQLFVVTCYQTQLIQVDVPFVNMIPIKILSVLVLGMGVLGNVWKGRGEGEGEGH